MVVGEHHAEHPGHHRVLRQGSHGLLQRQRRAHDMLQVRVEAVDGRGGLRLVLHPLFEDGLYQDGLLPQSLSHVGVVALVAKTQYHVPYLRQHLVAGPLTYRLAQPFL